MWFLSCQSAGNFGSDGDGQRPAGKPGFSETDFAASSFIAQEAIIVISFFKLRNAFNFHPP